MFVSTILNWKRAILTLSTFAVLLTVIIKLNKIEKELISEEYQLVKIENTSHSNAFRSNTPYGETKVKDLSNVGYDFCATSEEGAFFDFAPVKKSHIFFTQNESSVIVYKTVCSSWMLRLMDAEYVENIEYVFYLSEKDFKKMLNK